MKQKLLLALLAVFVSVGMMEVHGQSTTITPLDATRITVQKSGGAAWDASTTFAGATAATGVSANSVTLTGTAGTDITIPLTPASSGNSLNVTSLTISGKVTAIGDLSSISFLTSLSVTGNGELVTLGALPGTLTSLSVANNKLQVLPKKTPIMTSYNVGDQKPVSPGSWGTIAAGKSNKGWDVITTSSPSGFMGSIVESNQPVTLSGWTKYNTTNSTWVNTGEPQKNTAGSTSTTSRYYFMSGNVYMDGTYKFNKVTFDANSDYPGASISGIEGTVTVDVADFELLEATITPANSGKVLIYSKDAGGNLTPLTPSAATLVEKGTVLMYVPQEETGFAFTSFSALKGLTPYGTVNPNVQSREYTVTGDVAPTLTATFTGQSKTVSYDTSITGGTLRVTNNVTGAVINAGTSVPSGTVLKIEATPSVGYIIGNVNNLLVNGNNIGITNATIGTNGVLTANYTVSADNIIIGISFTASSGRALTIKFIRDDIAGVFVNNGSGTDPGDDPAGYAVRTYNVEVGSKPQIRVTTKAGYYVTNITANGAAVKYTTTSTGVLISDYVIPNDLVTMVIQTAKLQPITIIPTDEYVYDGTAKVFQFTTEPLNITGFKLEYKLSSDNLGLTYTTNPFIDASSPDAYTVRITRPADATFAEVNQEIKYTINKATPRISSLPTVTITKKPNVSPDTYQYTVTNGVAQYARGTGYVGISYGKWEVVEEAAEVPTNLAGASSIDPSSPETRMVVVRYMATNSTGTTDTNFEPAGVVVQAKFGTQELPNVTLRVVNPLPTGVTSIKMYNGQQEITSGTTVKAGTKITFVVVAPGYNPTGLKIQRIDSKGAAVGGPFLPSDGTDADGTEMIFTIDGTRMDDQRTEAYIKSGIMDNTQKYTGSGIYFNTNLIQLVDKNGLALPSSAPAVPTTGWKVTYKNSAGQAVVAPINAGTYTVEINREGWPDLADASQFRPISGTATLVILKADPVILDWPDKAYVAPGQKLSAAALVGGSSSIAGTFVFVDGDIVPTTGVEYAVKFVPTDKTNFNEISSTNPLDKVAPEISNKRFLTIGTLVNGTVTVKDPSGKVYTSGTEIPSNVTQLIITANPATGYTLASLTVNGSAFTNGGTYTLTSASVNVNAVFSTATSFRVNVTVPRGVRATLPSSNVVAAGGTYTFSLATAPGNTPAVVDEDGTVYSATNGVYSITQVVKDKTITITLSNPTAFSITATQPPHGDGTVTIANLTAPNSTTYYYGDTLRLTASLVGTAFFKSWWDGNTTNPRTYIVTGNQVISMNYSPVGNEPVEGLSVYSGEGYIQISAPGEVIVTVVTMNGQATRTKVAGQDRIEVPAGVYGVIVEQGTNVSQEKVIVR